MQGPVSSRGERCANEVFAEDRMTRSGTGRGAKDAAIQQTGRAL
jgi:hypothetical protein